MEQQYLIDTNAVIDYLGRNLPESGMTFMNKIMDDSPQISVITKIEVLGFKTVDKYYSLLVDFMNDANVLDLSNPIVDLCIEIRKNNRTKLPDVIIAATAIVNGFTLISRNVSDFKSISQLKTVNPYQL